MIKMTLIAHAALAPAALAVTLLGASAAVARPGTAGHHANHTATHPAHQTQRTTHNQVQGGQTQIGQVQNAPAVTPANGANKAEPSSYSFGATNQPNGVVLTDILISSVKTEPPAK